MRFVDALGYTHRIIGDYSLPFGPKNRMTTRVQFQAFALFIQRMFSASSRTLIHNLSNCEQKIITDVLSGEQILRVSIAANSNGREWRRRIKSKRVRMKLDDFFSLHYIISTLRLEISTARSEIVIIK